MAARLAPGQHLPIHPDKTITIIKGYQGHNRPILSQIFG